MSPMPRNEDEARSVVGNLLGFDEDGAGAAVATETTRGLLRQVELRNFGSHARTRLAFDQPITFFVGGNGAGKTTIPEAIEWCLTGRYARGVDGAGRGAEQLVAAGADAMRAAVELEGIGWVKRGVEGGKVLFAVDGVGTGDPQASLFDRLRTTSGFLHAVFNAYAFLDQDHAGAKAFVMDVLDVRVPIGQERLTLAQLQTRYKSAFDQRAAKKLQQKNHRVPPRPDGPEVNLAEVGELEAQLRELRHDEQERLSVSAEARGRKRTLQDHLDALTREQQSITTRLGKPLEPACDSAPDLAAAQRELASLDAPPEPAATDAGDTEVARLRQSLVDDRGRLTMYTTSLSGIEGRTPEKGCVLDPDVPCLTPPKEFTGRAKYLPKAIKALERSVAETTARLNVLEADVRARADADRERGRRRAALVAQVDTLERERRLREDVVRSRVADVDRLNEVLANIAHLETEVRNAGDDEADPDLEATRTRIAKGDETIKAASAEAQRWTAYNAAAAVGSALAREVSDLETQVELLGPKGAQLGAIGHALSRFLDCINAALGRFGYTLGINLDPWRLDVNGRPASRLSTSERLRVGISLQLALAELTGLDLVAFDNTEWLVDEAIRDVFSDLVFEWAFAKPGRQVLIVKATHEAIPAIEGVAVYRVAMVDRASTVTLERDGLAAGGAR